MKNSILADALLNAAKNSETESAITKLVASSAGEQQKQTKRKLHAQEMSLPELIRVKNEYSEKINDPVTSNEKKKEISEIIKSLNYEIRNRTKDTPAQSLKEPRSIFKQERRVARENYRKSIQVRSFKKTIPPNQFTISHENRSFLPLNEKTLERERLRKELIAKEAQAELDRMALISRVTHTKIIQEERTDTRKTSPAKVITKLDTNSTTKIEVPEFYFNSELYSQLIRTIPVTQAYKIAKSRELSSKYYDSKVESGKFSYFNSLAYLISLRSKNETDAREIAKEQGRSERVLYDLITVGYKISLSKKDSGAVRKKQEKN
jgi:hypothetical protein